MTSEHTLIPAADIFAEYVAERGGNVEALSVERLIAARETVLAAFHFVGWEWGKPDMDRQLALTGAAMTLAGLVQFLYGDEVWTKMLDDDG